VAVRSQSSERGSWLKFLLSVLALHWLLAIFLAYTLNIWADEASSLASTDGSLIDSARQSIRFEWQPPGYFAALWLWRQAHHSILWARVFSMVCTSAAIGVFLSVAQRIANERSKWPYLATLVLAVHPYLIFAATEIRLYGLAILLSILQFDLFLRTYVEEDKIDPWQILLVSIASLYVNILLGLTLAAQWLTLAIIGRTKQTRQYFSILAATLLAYLPMLLLQWQSVKDKDVPGTAMNVPTSFAFIASSILYSVAPVPRLESTQWLRVTLGLILLTGVVWLVRERWKQIAARQRQVWIYLVATGTLLAVFLVAAQLRANPRYTYPIVLVSLLAWGKLTDLIRSPRLAISIWMVSLVFCIATLITTYASLCKTGDWIRVAQFLESRQEADQPIVVFTSEIDTILKHYYRGPNQLIPVPGPQRMDRFRYADFDIPSEQAVQDLLQPILSQVNTCWLVINEAAIRRSPTQYHQEYLIKYLSQEFAIAESVEFVDSKVIRLERTSQLPVEH
jgi:hypothetical protein